MARAVHQSCNPFTSRSRSTSKQISEDVETARITSTEAEGDQASSGSTITPQFSGSPRGFGHFIGSVVEPTVIQYSMTEIAKNHFYIVYGLIYVQLFCILIPAMFLSLALFLFFWKENLESGILFFVEKIPESKIKVWLKKKKFYITPSLAKILICFVLAANLLLIFDMISLLRIIGRYIV